MESCVLPLCSFSDQLRGRTRGDVQRRTVPGRSARCGGPRGCRRGHHRLRSPAGREQTPTGKVYHLGDTKTHTKKATNKCNECTLSFVYVRTHIKKLKEIK